MVVKNDDYSCISPIQTQSTEQHIHKCVRDPRQHQRKEAEQGEQRGETMMSCAETHKQQQETKLFSLDLRQCVLLTGWRKSPSMRWVKCSFITGFVMTGLNREFVICSGRCVCLDHLSRDECIIYWILKFE